MDNLVIFLMFVSILGAVGLIGSVIGLWYRHSHRHQ